MNNPSEIWIAEDDRSLRWVMEKALVRDGIAVRSFENGDDLLTALTKAEPEIIISDIRMPGIDGLELLKKIHANHHHIPVIITTAHSDLDSAPLIRAVPLSIYQNHLISTNWLMWRGAAAPLRRNSDLSMHQPPSLKR